jgi:hypothetical protein
MLKQIIFMISLQAMAAKSNYNNSLATIRTREFVLSKIKIVINHYRRS